jgi:TonB family protein
MGEAESNMEIKLVSLGMEKTNRFLFNKLVYVQISTNVSNSVIDKPSMTAYENMSINGKSLSAKREVYSKGADYKMIVKNYLGDTKMNYVWLMKRELADDFSDQLNELLIQSCAPGSNTTVDLSQTDSLNVGNGEEPPPPPAYTETIVNEAEVFQFVEEMPEFPGGETALLEFIAKNVVYPKEAQENGISGKVFIQFVVMKDGKISNIKVLRGVDPSLDAEAVNVIKKLPIWKPGKQKGTPVNVSYTVPIKFVLE